MSRKLYKPLYCAFGEPSYYVVCTRCGRGVGVSKYGIIRRHYRRCRQHKGFSKIVCEKSGKYCK